MSKRTLQATVCVFPGQHEFMCLQLLPDYGPCPLKIFKTHFICVNKTGANAESIPGSQWRTLWQPTETSQSPHLRRTHCPRLRSRTPDPGGSGTQGPFENRLLAHFFQHIVTPRKRQKCDIQYTTQKYLCWIYFFVYVDLIIIRIYMLFEHPLFWKQQKIGFCWGFNPLGFLRLYAKRVTMSTIHFQPIIMLCGFVGNQNPVVQGVHLMFKSTHTHVYIYIIIYSSFGWVPPILSQFYPTK